MEEIEINLLDFEPNSEETKSTEKETEETIGQGKKKKKKRWKAEKERTENISAYAVFIKGEKSIIT